MGIMNDDVSAAKFLRVSNARSANKRFFFKFYPRNF